ncbi:Twin-arginine translocation protein TatB [hydrothermal vent metagenome]|uniref:Twin-arginine translocation protein TatB n=1 Tax=hydrothermal vent metagenome TaxID=652676 RepID=A0A3B0WV53_9ZZZZ
MFDIGLWEILLILVLALVVIGPERLPSAARQAGLFIGKARRYVEGVRSEVESELDIGEFKRMLHNQEVQINELQQQLKSGVDDVKADMPSSNIMADSPLPDSHNPDDVMPEPYKASTSRPIKNETADADTTPSIENEKS